MCALSVRLVNLLVDAEIFAFDNRAIEIFCFKIFYFKISNPPAFVPSLTLLGIIGMPVNYSLLKIAAFFKTQN